MTLTAPDLLRGTPYVAYAYSYPHKTAYRPLNPPVPLEAVWEGEGVSRLFGYIHIPFCEMRCGFCNLFTTARPPTEQVQTYLDALARHMDAVAAAVPHRNFARYAIGGGTPTYLDAAELDCLFIRMSDFGIHGTPYRVRWRRAPTRPPPIGWRY